MEVIKLSTGLIMIEDSKGNPLMGYSITKRNVKIKDSGELDGEAVFNTIDNNGISAIFSISKIENLYVIKYYEEKGFIYFYCKEVKFI